MFHALQAVLTAIGPHNIVPLKTMIILSTVSSFGGITFTRARLDLGFFLTHLCRHERIHRVERLSPRKYAHHVRLSSPAEVDEQVGQWLREAYEGGTTSGPR